MLIHRARKIGSLKVSKELSQVLGDETRKESDKRFVEKLIQLFEDVKNKVKV
jgi:hypothetical protein